MSKADIAVVGLAVMGENLILNMESKGFTVACFNRTVSKVDNFINGRAKGKNIIGCKSIEQLCAAVKKPRKIMLMVNTNSSGISNRFNDSHHITRIMVSEIFRKHRKGE